MGSELYRRLRGFADAVDEVCAVLDPLVGWSVRDVMFGAAGAGPGSLAQTGFAQPALFVLEAALFRLLRQWGVRPALLVGHSVGEVAAAHAAGVLSLPDAAMLVAARARLMQALPPGGAMVAVRAEEAQVLPFLHDCADQVVVAAVNGPASVVISGQEAAVLRVATQLRQHGYQSSQLRVSHAFHSPQMAPMLEEFSQAIAGLSFTAPHTPMISTVTTTLATAEQLCTPDYWVQQVRLPVRFHDAITTPLAQDVTCFLELGPNAALSTFIPDRAANSNRADKVTAIPTLRGHHNEPQALSAALAQLHVHGHAPNWHTIHTGHSTRQPDLPTYAFQHQHFWLATHTPTNNGIDSTDHPLLATIVDTPENGGWVLTGRISLRTHPWLGDHLIGGRHLFPGAAFVELAVHAGAHVDSAGVEELTLQAPLTLTNDPTHLRVTIGAADAAGSRPLSVHSRPDGARNELWTRHASGVLAAATSSPVQSSLPWPPTGPDWVEIDHPYRRTAAAGAEYGPTFQGLRRVWRRGGEILADVTIPRDARTEARRYGLHPALLDAALQPMLLIRAVDDEPMLPFSFNDVTLHTAGASALRVWLVPAADGSVSLDATDPSGRPVISIRSAAMRPVPRHQPTATGNGLFGITWSGAGRRSDREVAARRWLTLGPDDPSLVAALTGTSATVEACADIETLAAMLEAGRAAPDVVVTTAHKANPDSDIPSTVRAATSRALHLIQSWLGDKHFASSQLVLTTHSAVATGQDDTVDDLAGTAVSGLVRSAQTEHPGRIVLVDIDDDEESRAALPAAVATGAAHLAIRSGLILSPALTQLRPTPTTPVPPGLGGGTVLVTGGTGVLGGLVARHLVSVYGVGHVLLVGRRGRGAVGEVEAGLVGLGGSVSVVACDVGDRGALAGVLGLVPDGFPLVGVVHAAGVLDDGVVTSLSSGRVDGVLRPKVDGGWFLHELTEGLGLSMFVLFSSVAGVLGGAGQGGYAAANCFLDGLAEFRRGRGLPATSIAWGWWQDAGMTAGLSARDLDRIRRTGLVPMPAERGLALFDAAIGVGNAAVVAAEFEPVTTRAGGPDRIAPVTTGGTDPISALRQRLSQADSDERDRILLALVRAQTAAALGHTSPEGIEEHLGFLAMGLDSLTAVELRNQLALAIGLRLPATLLFDHPTPAELARHLGNEIAAGETSGTVASHDPVGELDTALARMVAQGTDRSTVLARIRALLEKYRGPATEPTDGLHAATDAELFRIIDEKLGRDS